MYKYNSNSRYDLIQKYFLNKNSNNSNNSNINITKLEDISILVINNALPDDIYNLLSNDFCSLKEVFLNDKNHINNVIMLSNHLYTLKINPFKNNFKKTLTDILEYHFSKNFIDNVLKIYQDLFNLNNLNFINSSNMIMNINYFSPVCYLPSQIKAKGNAIRTLIDISKHNVLGWFFMRRDEDNSSGGNLEIYNNNHRVLVYHIKRIVL